MSRPVRRRFVDTSVGPIHVATCGDPAAPPVLLLHQSPRSWREYDAVLPLLGTHRFAIAMDTVGFGDSPPPPWPPTIERWAAVAHELLDAMGVDTVDVAGHHTGGVIAIEMAASRGDRVRRLVLSSTPWVDAPGRERRRQRALPVDALDRDGDGGHLQSLWRQRQPYYPADRPELLEAYLLDALRAHGDPAVGHHVVAAYEMEKRIDRVRQPVLILRATADPFASPQAEPLRAAMHDARIVDIEGGGVPLPDQMPERFAAEVDAFLR
ncbi:MAG: alpha/beta hydrolase [Burkholderiales bacterium]|jgi:pimeloyl-ACP methyl ester carboxylesterase